MWTMSLLWPQLHVMADRGEVELLGVMVSGRNEWSAPCVDAINTFYGRPDIPIGLVSSTRGIRQDSHFANAVAEAFPQDFRKPMRRWTPPRSIGACSRSMRTAVSSSLAWGI